MADLLEVRDLCVQRERRPLLEQVSLTLAAGQILALLGPNGAGKSTLLKTLAGLLPYQGEILFSGRAAPTLSARERAQELAYVPQHSALAAPLLVHEVVAQGRFAHRDAWGRLQADDPSAVSHALTATGAHHLAERSFTRLSYGERRLVLLARALATGARILLLDEPTAALDVGHALSLLHVLRNLARNGHAVLVALHLLNEATDFATHALLLQQGRVLRVGTVTEVVAPGPVREAFGVDILPGAHFGFRNPEESES